MHQNNTKKSFLDSMHPLWLVLLIQMTSVLLIKATSVFWAPLLSGLAYAHVFLACQVGLVLLLSGLLGLPRWWLWVQALLPIGLYWGATQTLVDPLWFALSAALLMLIFSAVLKDRVPLYLTNDTTHQALVALVQTYQVRAVLDLGSGLGGVVRALARAGIDVKGVEYSPLLALLSNQLCRWRGEGQISQGDMWQTDLGQVDMVYVFLSPVPMTRLWQKACAEMKSGALLVSNSFAIEGVEPLEVWELSDKRQTRLFIYQIP